MRSGCVCLFFRFCDDLAFRRVGRYLGPAFDPGFGSPAARILPEHRFRFFKLLVVVVDLVFGVSIECGTSSVSVERTRFNRFLFELCNRLMRRGGFNLAHRRRITPRSPRRLLPRGFRHDEQLYSFHVTPLAFQLAAPTAFAMPRERLAGQQAAAVPGEGRFNQRGRLESWTCGATGGSRFRLSRLCGRSAAVLRKRLAGQHEGRHGTVAARCWLRCSLRLQKRKARRRRFPLRIQFPQTARLRWPGFGWTVLRAALSAASATATTPPRQRPSVRLRRDPAPALLHCRQRAPTRVPAGLRTRRLCRGPRSVRGRSSCRWPLRGPRSSLASAVALTAAARRALIGCCTSRGAWPAPLAAALLQLVGFFLVFELDEVGYVEERVALQAQVDKCRLHAGQNRVTRPL